MFQENECKKTKTREHNMCYFQQIVVFILFSLLRRNTSQKQFRTKFYLIHAMKNTVHGDVKSVAAGDWGGGSHCICSQQ